MPFLGNEPSNTFVSIAKQTITGNGGTSYALSYSVTSANDIDVFFNNVRQEPTVAYTATGTTITFTEAIASTDSVYVLYNAQAIGTISPPTGSVGPTALDRAYVQDSSGVTNLSNVSRLNFNTSNAYTIITSLNPAGSAFTNNYFNGLSHTFQTSGTDRLVIDSSGRVTITNQPAFYAYNGAAQNPGSVYTVQFTIAALNNGGHYNTSNYRFTAPIAGKYVFTFSGMSNGSYNRFGLFVNNTLYSDQRFSTNQGYENFGATWIISLSSGDYVEIKNDIQSNGQGDIHGDYRNFGGYLLG